MRSKVSALGCFAILSGWTIGCGGNTTTSTAPSAAGPMTVVALTIAGNGALAAPGDTTQLSAQGTLSDGSKKDMTSTANWSSEDQRVATVSSTGLVTAVDFGKTTVEARMSGSSAPAASFPITVRPQGTYTVSGRVVEAGYFPVADARVEIIGGPMSGRVAITDSAGYYTFNGVTGVLQVRASKDGYTAATADLSFDTEHVNLVLRYDAPPTVFGDVYRLTFTAAPSCELPDDVRRRTYTATINRGGFDNRAIITLTGAQFWTDGYCGLMNSFDALVHGSTVSLSNYGGDCGVIEQLANMRYLSLWGTAEAALTNSTSAAAFDGSVSVVRSPSDMSHPIAKCKASDHQLLFERMTSLLRR